MEKHIGLTAGVIFLGVYLLGISASIFGDFAPSVIEAWTIGTVGASLLTGGLLSLFAGRLERE